MAKVDGTTAPRPEANSGRHGLCFVIGPTGAKGTDIRKHADDLLDFLIRPAAEKVGLNEVMRADHIESSGTITTEIVEKLTTADVVVADLSHSNPNAYYELAIRHLIRRPFVHVISEGHSLPFDVGTTRMIRFDLHDIRSVSQAVDELSNTISNEMSKDQADIETPFTVALDRINLRDANARSGEEDQGFGRVVARLESTIFELARQMQGFESMLERLAERPTANDRMRRIRQLASERDMLRRELELAHVELAALEEQLGTASESSRRPAYLRERDELRRRIASLEAAITRNSSEQASIE